MGLGVVFGQHFLFIKFLKKCSIQKDIIYIGLDMLNHLYLYDEWEHVYFNLMMLSASKSSLTISLKSFKQNHNWKKLFEGEMLLRALSTTLLQIFRKIFFNSKVIIKNIRNPDDNL